MTGAELMYVVGFFITVFGSIFGVWKYLDGKLTANRKDTEKVAQDLAAHKLHAAETFATKASQAEQTTQLLRAIESVGNRIDGVHERLDRLYENAPRRTTRG
ncbi:hypothetical protein [Rhizobium sp. LC145]|uniref:hypothetical protein n=1 Tax=Rhizobium sp. LC145 TaxID=1120688 RepID=UPI00062A3F42|nr:hypothetical protein [Rhizobium sp. LC145]KKX33960.1 phage related protein [Rhizobium sp. LC145]